MLNELISIGICACLTWTAGAFPVGVNLSPVGGNSNEMGGTYNGVNWDSMSTYVFVDIFKHCTAMYLRSTSNNGGSFTYQSNSAVTWRIDGYPASLPYTSLTNYYAALCDIGAGGNFVQDGMYRVTWQGTGDIGFASSTASMVSYDKTNRQATVRLFASQSTLGVNVRLWGSGLNPVHNVSIIPVAFVQNYTTQIFQPSFLNIISGFQLIRFTGWQKSGNANRVWSMRTTPNSQSQHQYDGVAIEHIIDLIRITRVPAIWLSFPLTSSDYNKNAVALFANSLNVLFASDLTRTLTLYYEASCPEVNGDNDIHQESLALFTLFDTIFKRNTTMSNQLTLKATVSVSNIAYIAYVPTRFGASLSRIDAIAIVGQFGRSSQPGDHYNSYSTWDLTYANYTTQQLLAEFRSSVLIAEFMWNTMRQTMLNTPNVKPTLEFVSYSSGGYATADGYGYRAGLYTVNNCIQRSSFPCVWANTKYNFANMSQATTALPKIQLNASLEQQLQMNLATAMRDESMVDLILDMMERWHRIGGGSFVSPMLVKPMMPCTTGGKGCGNEAMFESPLFNARCASLNGCPQYSALLSYQQGMRSRLPFTSNDLPLHPSVAGLDTCNPHCKWGTCWWGQCICFAGYHGLLCDQLDASAPNRCNANVGMNLAGVVDYSTELPFVNVLNSGRPWISQQFYNSPWSTNTQQILSLNGYPASLSVGQKLGSMMIRDLKGHVRGGVFIVLYEGDGTINFGMDIVGVRRSVGRIEVTVAPSTGLNNGIFLMIERTNPADPIRNIRVVMPGYENTFVAFPFHPLFLNSLKQYATIRFMGWQNTNSAPSGNWSQRSLPSNSFSYSTSSAGVQIERMILLANTLGTNAWFNMPHLASDDYITQFATLVGTTMRPDVDIYIEYSNEVWGTLFPGGQYAQQQGLLMGLSTNAVTARFCYYMLRSSQLFRIWKSVFANLAVSNPRTGKLRFVVGSQAVNYDVTRQLLMCPATSSMDFTMTSIAIAPYFGTYNPVTDTNLGKFMNSTLPKQIASLSTQLAGHSLWARRYNTSLITYECGIGLAGSSKSNDLAIQVNRDIRLSSLYVQYMNLLSSYGISMIMIFDSAGLYDYNQAWGTLEASDQNPISSPKYVGISNFIASHLSSPSCLVSAAAPNIPIVSCPSGCSNAGVCDYTSGRCECFYGAGGSGCELSTYTKHTDQCGYYCTFHQGICVPDYVVGNDMYFKCVCNAGYFGVQCASFKCNNNCYNNGLCLDASMCSCFPGFTGVNCDVDCGCGGHGVCVADVYSSIQTQYDDSKNIVQPLGVGQSCMCDIGYIWDTASRSCLLSTNTAIRINNSSGNTTTCSSINCKFGTCLSSTECACWAGFSGNNCDQRIPKPNDNSIIGTTISGISYYSQEWAFVDVMKMSSDWVSVDDATLISTNYEWGNGMNISLRPDGYPAMLQVGQVLVKLMLRDVHLHAPAGKYVCLYDGDGLLDFGMDADVTLQSKGRVEFVFMPTTVVGCTRAYCSDNGIYLRLLRTNVDNPIHNIRVLMPGFEDYDKVPFHPYFLKNLEQYSTLRFMGWQNTNNNNEVHWTDRPTANRASQSNGVALEHMILLANILGANVWFSMPHGVTDDYFLKFATMLRDNLRPDVKVYIEYSNEVWNTLFSQGIYAKQQGLALKLSSNPTTAQYRFYSQRSVEMFQIFNNTFALSNAQNTNRLIAILSTFTISPSATTTILSWKNASMFANMVAIAPYFDCGGLGNNAATTSLMNVSSVIVACTKTMPTVGSVVQAIVTVAKSFNLPVVTYEAGQSLVESSVISYNAADNPIITALFIAVNRDPRMQDVYRAYINTLITAGIVSNDRPLMHFASVANPTKYGSWGALEFTGMQIQFAPKFLALREYFAANTPSSDAQYPPNLCADSSYPSVLTMGVGDYSYSGFPAVSSPQLNQVWIPGSVQAISWDGSGADIAATVTIVLRSGAYCRDGTFSVNSSNTGAAYWVLTTGVLQSAGVYSFAVPTSQILSAFGFANTGKFFIEIRPSLTTAATQQFAGSNFSSFFSISDVGSALDLSSDSSAMHCCAGLLIPDIGSCLNVAVSLIGSPSDFSFGTSSIRCTDDVNLNANYPKWSGSCIVDPLTGCMTYRTQSNGKPVTDCTAQWSPDFASPAYWLRVDGLLAACMNHNAPSISCTDGDIYDSYCDSVSAFRGMYNWHAPSAIPIGTPSQSPTILPSDRTTPGPSSAPTSFPTTVASSISTPTTVPTIIATMRPSSMLTLQPAALRTSIPSRRPTKIPTALPTTRNPSRKPSWVPATAPTKLPTKVPTDIPTAVPTDGSTPEPTLFDSPTSQPTEAPIFLPTPIPTRPTARPSATPSLKPRASPTPRPTTTAPTTKPSKTPTFVPSKSPTTVPTAAPTAVPSAAPTATPTLVDSPTSEPTECPTTNPTEIPTIAPSSKLKKPTARPSRAPSRKPVRSPTPPPTR